MGQARSPSNEDFECLLAWLDPNRERAGLRYEEIRRRLIKVFARRGCTEGESLADETINRVTLNACEVAPRYTGDPALYFLGVAKNVLHEYWRREAAHRPSPPAPCVEDQEEAEREDECLEHCMQQVLNADERTLMLQYFQEQGEAKIKLRQELAQRHGLGSNALRIRIHRLLKRLRPCVQECLA